MYILCNPKGPDTNSPFAKSRPPAATPFKLIATIEQVPSLTALPEYRKKKKKLFQREADRRVYNICLNDLSKMSN